MEDAVRNKRPKYWCQERKVWIEEYDFLYFWTIYKESVFGKKPKWTFKECQKPMTKAVSSKIEITVEEAIKRWGPNKWTWPDSPYDVIGFNKYKTPMDIEREKAKKK